MKTIRRSLALFLLLVAAFIVAPSAAQATTKGGGPYYTSNYYCAGVFGQVQGVYFNYNSTLTRASGFGAYRSDAYIRKVTVIEYDGGVQKGYRIINYSQTGTSHWASQLNIPTTYLPDMNNFDYINSSMTVTALWSDGNSCSAGWDIGRP